MGNGDAAADARAQHALALAHGEEDGLRIDITATVGEELRQLAQHILLGAAIEGNLHSSRREQLR